MVAIWWKENIQNMEDKHIFSWRFSWKAN